MIVSKITISFMQNKYFKDLPGEIIGFIIALAILYAVNSFFPIPILFQALIGFMGVTLGRYFYRNRKLKVSGSATAKEATKGTIS